MYKLGRVLHLGSGGNLILKGGNKVRIGDRVIDDKKKVIGVISDVFGPTNSFYISVKTRMKNPHSLINNTLYAAHPPRRKRRR